VNVLSKKIVLSGVPHSVQTSDWTNNAINPRNTFSDNSDDVPLQDEVSQPMLTEQYDTQSSLSVPKEHVTTHRQTIAKDKLLDDHMVFDARHQIQDRIENLRNQNLSANRQCLREEETPDNWQSVGDGSIRHKNMQPAADVWPVRPAPDLSHPSHSVQEPGPTEMLVPPELSMDEAAPPTKDSSSAFAESALMARVRQMKEKLVEVNQSLNDIEDDK
jgi:hypothetical protein